MGALAAVLSSSAPCRAERLPAWRGTSLSRLTASREALTPGAARHGGPFFLIDEAYAGPWAYSPLSASPRGAARDAVSPLGRAFAPPTPGGNQAPADGARSVDGLLRSLGPVGLLASIVVPAAVASSGVSGRFGGQGAATRVGFAKMGGGYGILVAGRF
ncbi:MAG TPA: hypothetical protein VFS00_33080 [Polyangiaceae bacterium]|nr:hypothetical protein [Polyangiaceae bacterium]